MKAVHFAQQKRTLQLAAAMLCIAASLASARAADELAASAAQKSSALTAYYDGREVEFTPQRTYFSRDLKFGPWDLGERHREKPSDHDPNLYIVVPGTQHVAKGNEPFNHNRVIAVLPQTSKPRTWDVYWAVVLDPTLDMDYRSERELLVAAQEEFHPSQDYSIEKLPAHAVLTRYLNIQTVADLEKYRHPNGTLPGILIVTTGYSVVASVVDPNAPQQSSQKNGAVVARGR